MIPLFISLASAAPAAANSAPVVEELHLGAAGVGESVLQAGLQERYDQISGSLSAELVVGARLRPPVNIELDLGFRSLSGTDDAGGALSLKYFPMALVGMARLDVGAVDLLGGAGVAMVIWDEDGGTTSKGYLGWGARPGLQLQVEGRWHTPWLSPSPLSPPGNAKGLDLFVTASTRLMWVPTNTGPCDAPSCGMDFSAVRVAAGGLVRF